MLAPVQNENVKTISVLKSSQSKHKTKSQEMETDKRREYKRSDNPSARSLSAAVITLPLRF